MSSDAHRKFTELLTSSSVSRASAAIARKANTTNFTPEQLECIDRLECSLARVLECKRRDQYLHSLAHCVATYSDADREEPLTADAFNVYECYRTFTQDLVYFPDKFDFLLYCIMNRVCTVHKPRQFNELLDDILMPPTVALAQRIGGELLSRLIEDDQEREDDEMRRIELFVPKAEWKKMKRNEKRQRAAAASGVPYNEDDDDDEDVFVH